MTDKQEGVNLLLAKRVKELRGARNLSLDALAKKTGVSRSMISLIERAECSPTALVLEKLAVGLGVLLPSLFEVSTGGAAAPLVRAKDQTQWQDPDTGYVRRNISPPGHASSGQIVEVRFPAGARLLFDSTERNTEVHQQIWMLEGSMEIGVGEERHLLRPGDCLKLSHDKPLLYHNPTKSAARYAVFTVTYSLPGNNKR